jgi:hypothetical protein
MSNSTKVPIETFVQYVVAGTEEEKLRAGGFFSVVSLHHVNFRFELMLKDENGTPYPSQTLTFLHFSSCGDDRTVPVFTTAEVRNTQQRYKARFTVKVCENAGTDEEEGGHLSATAVCLIEPLEAVGATGEGEQVEDSDSDSDELEDEENEDATVGGVEDVGGGADAGAHYYDDGEGHREFE